MGPLTMKRKVKKSRIRKLKKKKKNQEVLKTKKFLTTTTTTTNFCQKMVVLDFPGGPVVKNLPANAGDAGSLPGLGRSHMPWSN